MTPAERVTLTEALGKLALLLGVDVSKDRLKAYLTILGDLPLESLVGAIERYGQAATFPRFPLPGEIRELVEGSGSERAEHAWTLLVKACHESGDASVYIQDQALAKAMVDTFGGWIPAYETVVHLTPEMTASKRKEFISHYRRWEKHPSGQDERFHPGRHEITNKGNLHLWSQKWIEQGRLTFEGKVLVIREGLELMPATYDVKTGEMTGGSRKQLVSGEAPKQIERTRATHELPEPSAEARAMTPEEIKAGIQALAKRNGNN